MKIMEHHQLNVLLDSFDVTGILPELEVELASGLSRFLGL
jgi:hypothetical protein